jgi:hypothetical protein
MWMGALRAICIPSCFSRLPVEAAWHSRRRWLGWGAGIVASLAVGGKWWWETQAFTLRRLTGALTAITREGITLDLMSMDKDVVGE